MKKHMRKSIKQIVASILMVLTVIVTVISGDTKVFAADTSTVGRICISDHDSASYEQVEGGVYAIYSDDDCQNEVGRVTTKKKGTADTDELIEGVYYVRQITPPNGYAQVYGVSTVKVEGGRNTIHMRVNDAKTGFLSIGHTGEKVSGWDGTQFLYESQDIGNSAVKITAAEDIYRADGTLAYQKDDVVIERLEPKKSGAAYADNLVIGAYEVTELEPITGYLNNETPFRVEMEYPDVWASQAYEYLSIPNQRQKAQITVASRDAMTGNIITGYEYTLYAGQDIRTADGQVIVSKGVALETVATDEYGEAAFTVDIPPYQKYYVAETKAPNGYAKNPENTYEFYFNCTKEETDKIVSFSHVFQSTRASAKLQICVKDALTEEFKPQGDASFQGNVYGIYAKEDIVHPDGASGTMYQAGELVAKAETDENGEAIVKNLYLGKYVIKHLQESEGYQLSSESCEVICNYEGQDILEVSRRAEVGIGVKCQPVFIRINVQKTESTKTEPLQGAGFSLYLKSQLTQKADGTYDFAKATPVDLTLDGDKELFSNEYGTVFTDYLPYGTYIAVETTVPDKTTTAEPFEIELFENSPKQALEEYNLTVQYLDETEEEPVTPPSKEPEETPTEQPEEKPAEEPEKEPTKEPEKTPVATAPKTGDNSGYGLWISAGLIAVGAILLWIIQKKNKKK